MAQGWACGLGSLTMTGFVPNRSDAGLLAPKPPHFAAQGETRHLHVHQRRSVAVRVVRPQTGTESQVRQDGTEKGKAARAALEIRTAWRERDVGFRGLSASGQATDHLCMLNGMQTTSRAHPIAIPMLHTGEFQFVRPSLGSWVLYGLGNREPGLARVLHDQADAHLRRTGKLRQRIPAQHVSGDTAWLGRPVRQERDDPQPDSRPWPDRPTPLALRWNWPSR